MISESTRMRLCFMGLLILIDIGKVYTDVCPEETTMIVVNRMTGTEEYELTASENCERITNSLKGGKGSMRCKIEESSPNRATAFVDLVDLAEGSTNYLKKLCLSVRHVKRVKFLMGSFSPGPIVHEMAIENIRNWTDLCLESPFTGENFDYFDWRIEFYADDEANYELVKVKNLEMKICNFFTQYYDADGM